jgi:hypothetical protein
MVDDLDPSSVLLPSLFSVPLFPSKDILWTSTRRVPQDRAVSSPQANVPDFRSCAGVLDPAKDPLQALF